MSPRSVTNCPSVELCLPFRRALFAAVRAGGERPALVTFERVLSCRALGRKPDRVRDALLRSGLGPDPGPGAVVSLAPPHGWAWAVALSAVLRCGAVLAPATARSPPTGPRPSPRRRSPRPGPGCSWPAPARPRACSGSCWARPSGCACSAAPLARPGCPVRTRGPRSACARANAWPSAGRCCSCRAGQRCRPGGSSARSAAVPGPAALPENTRRTPGNPWGRPSRRPAVPVFRRAAASPARTPTTAAARPPSGTV